MKTKIVYLFGLLTLLSATGCDKEDIPDDNSFFLDIENEVVTEELIDVPAYVWHESRDITVVCYSRYAHEYGEQILEKSLPSYGDETINAIHKDLIEHLIGIPTVDYKKYQIGLNQNIYITASITNNNTRSIEKDNDSKSILILIDTYYTNIYKAYLKDVRQFN